MQPHLEISQDNLDAMKSFALTNTEPIVMVNLMQLRPRAHYADPSLNNCTGLEAFARYTTESAEVRKKSGGGIGLVWRRHTDADWTDRENLGHGGLCAVPQHERVSDHGGNRCISSSQRTQASGPARLKIDYDASEPLRCQTAVVLSHSKRVVRS